MSKGLVCTKCKRSLSQKPISRIIKGHKVLSSLIDKDLLYKKWNIVMSGKSSFRAIKRVNKSDGDYKKSCLLSRKIYEKIINRKLNKYEYIDHINQNPLDNRRENLRIATLEENSRNSFNRRPNKSSKYKGVSKTSDKKKYQAIINYNGESRFLGRFKRKIDAAKSYDKAARKYHKEFAATNFLICNFCKKEVCFLCPHFFCRNCGCQEYCFID